MSWQSTSRSKETVQASLSWPAALPCCRMRSWPMIRSPGTSGLVGNPVIGPEAVKNRIAVSWLAKVS